MQIIVRIYINANAVIVLINISSLHKIHAA